MHYDFTSIMERKGMAAIAVDCLGNPGFPGATNGHTENRTMSSTYPHSSGA